jgi:hypothetical protein
MWHAYDTTCLTIYTMSYLDFTLDNFNSLEDLNSRYKVSKVYLTLQKLYIITCKLKWSKVLVLNFAN